MPQCSKCFQPSKTYSNATCRVCLKAYKDVYNAFYRLNSKEKVEAYNKAWKDANIDKVREANTAYRSTRYTKDPSFRQKAVNAQRDYRQRIKEKNELERLSGIS